MIDKSYLLIEEIIIYTMELTKFQLDCKKFGKPLIMATENLGSLYNQNTPSKNDIISLGHSMGVNSDMIMLN